MVFTFVWHPFESLFSYYKDKQNEDKDSFSEFANTLIKTFAEENGINIYTKKLISRP